MTHLPTVRRAMTGLACLVLIFGITVDILDELPSGSDPQPVVFDRAPITSPQLDGPLFRIEENAIAQDQITGVNPVADTQAAVQAAAVTAAANTAANAQN